MPRGEQIAKPAEWGDPLGRFFIFSAIRTAEAVILRRCTMNARQAQITCWFAMLTLAACGEPSDRAPIAAPSFAVGGVGRPAVLVNPDMKGNGTATTIQEGIDMVAEGGKVMVVPGTYAEALVINKGLTLEAVGGGSGPVLVAPPRTPNNPILLAPPSAPLSPVPTLQ